MMRSLKRFARSLAQNTEGVTMLEYGLIAALIGIILIISLDFIGERNDQLFGGISTDLQNVNNNLAP